MQEYVAAVAVSAAVIVAAAAQRQEFVASEDARSRQN